MAEETAAPAPTESAPEVEVNSPSWTDGLGEDAQGYVENKGWDGAEQMLDSYRNLEKSMGAPADQILHLPKEDADAEEWGAVYNRLGRPEEASGYEFSGPEVPEGGIDLTPDLANWAHEAGLSKKQAQSIYEKYNGRLAEVNQEFQTQRAEQASSDEQALRKEWGTAWEENIAAGTRFRQRFNLDDGTMDKLESALGLRGLLELSAEIGRGLGEHRMPGDTEQDSGAGTTFGMTPAAAKAKIGDLTLDEKFMAQYIEGHPEAVARMTRLHSLAHPEAPGLGE